jgi:cytidine deaminase
MSVTDADLIRAATDLVGEFPFGKANLAASVAAALVTRAGNVYTGICIDTICSLGFCAEHAAVAEMLKHRETEIDRIVAVGPHGIMPPCGRCRELLWQVSPGATLLLASDERVKLEQLLPRR